MSKITNKKTQSPIQDWPMNFVQKEKNWNSISNFGRPYFYAQLNKFVSNDAFYTNKDRNKNQGHK